jgi:hypothetical protein
VFASYEDVDKNIKEFNYFANRLRKAITSDEHKDLFNKIVVNVASKDEFKSELKSDYAIQKAGAAKRNDVCVGLRVENTHYKLSLDDATECGKFSVDSIVQFIKDYKDGKLVGKVKVSNCGDNWCPFSYRDGDRIAVYFRKHLLARKKMKWTIRTS